MSGVMVFRNGLDTIALFRVEQRLCYGAAYDLTVAPKKSI